MRMILATVMLASLVKKTLPIRKMAISVAHIPVTLRLIEPWYRNAIFASQKIEQVVVALDVNMEAAALAGMAARFRHKKSRQGLPSGLGLLLWSIYACFRRR